MKLVKGSLIAAVAAASLVGAGVASAQVIGGGATLSEKLLLDLVGPGTSYGWDYSGTGSGTGKNAFFTNDAQLFNGVHSPAYPDGTAVHYAGSDSIVSEDERTNYNDSSNTVGRSAFGPLVQVPLAATSVAIAYNIPGASSLTLDSDQLAGIFAGQYDTWKDVDNSLPNTAIKIVYRTGGSGTTEIFARHLNAIDSARFSVKNDFSQAVNSGVSSTKYVPANGSQGVIDTIENIVGAIGYISPDYVDVNDAGKVASLINKNDLVGYLPTEVNVQATMASVNPPAGAAAADAYNWGVTFPDPQAGYPIAGFTFIIASQCYSDPANGASINDFFDKHYSGNFASEVSAHDLIPLAANWNTAIHDRFAKATAATSINHATVCGAFTGR